MMAMVMKKPVWPAPMLKAEMSFGTPSMPGSCTKLCVSIPRAPIMANPGLLPGSLRYMIYVPASVEKQHLKKSFPFRDRGSPVLELLGSQVLEGSLVLAEAGGIK